MYEHQKTIMMQNLLDKVNSGDPHAIEVLIKNSQSRFKMLTKKMLGRFMKVKRWEETSDVLQNAMIRLHRSLIKVQPVTIKEFYGLAALEIKRELLDLKRHYYGPLGSGKNHATLANVNQSNDEKSLDLEDFPAQEGGSFDIHELIDKLSVESKEIMLLHVYQGLSQEEIADVLNVSVRTIKRRYRSAKIELQKVINTYIEGGEHPIG